MSTQGEYSPVGLLSSPTNAASTRSPNDKRPLSRMLLATPLYYFLLDPLLQILPSGLVTGVFTVATAWRRFMAYRPIRAPLLNDVTVAHVLLCLPLCWWFVKATDLAVLQPTSHHSLSHSGEMTSYVMTFAFLTASKSHSLVTLVTGLSFERLMNFHLASALLTLWMGCLHGIQIAYWHRGDNKTHHHHDHDEDHHDDHDHHHSHDDHHHDSHDDHDSHDHHDHDDHDHDGHRRLHHDSIHAFLGPDPSFLEFCFDGQRNKSGTMVLVALVLLIVTSVFHRVLRKWWFEFWFIYHIAGAIVVLVAGLIHGADVFVFVIIWWALDLLIRYVFMIGIRHPQSARVTRVAENVTQLQFDKTDAFQYEAGQFVQVSIPSVQLWEFHPFSIASTPEEPYVTLYVRALPDSKTWTRNLYDLAAPTNQLSKNNDTQTIRIFLEGPYGSVPPILERPEKYSMAVFISGGIGVTPCRSIAQHLVANPHPSLQKIRYIWSIRDEGMIQAIPPPTLENGSGNNSSHASDDNGIELVERVQEDQVAGTPTSEDNTNDSEDDVLAEDSPRLRLQNDVYVSSMGKFVDDHPKGDGEEEEGIVVDKPKQEETDSYKIHRGRRPDVNAILSQVQTEAQKEGWGRVFVMGCGPVSLLEELEVACRRNQTNDVQIDYHQEVFDY